MLYPEPLPRTSPFLTASPPLIKTPKIPQGHSVADAHKVYVHVHVQCTATCTRPLAVSTGVTTHKSALNLLVARIIVGTSVANDLFASLSGSEWSVEPVKTDAIGASPNDTATDPLQDPLQSVGQANAAGDAPDFWTSVENFYRSHNPEKVKNKNFLEGVQLGFAGREEELWESLHRKCVHVHAPHLAVFNKSF